MDISNIKDNSNNNNYNEDIYNNSEDPILVNKFDTKYNENYSIYLGIFPYKMYESDFKFILDGAFEFMVYWVKSLRWNPTSPEAHMINDFAKGSTLYITDIDGREHTLTKGKLIKGLTQALNLYGETLIYRKNELKTFAFTSSLCDDIVQYSIYGKYEYINGFKGIK